MEGKHIDEEALTAYLQLYRITNEQKYLSLIYQGFSTICKHTLDKKLRKTNAYQSKMDREEIVHDATTRIIVRIMVNKEYDIPPHVWKSKAYYEVIKQLYSEHRKRWDQVVPLLPSDREEED